MIVHILHGVLIAYRDVAGPVFFFMWAVIFRSRSILGNGGGTVFTEAREFLECAAVAFGLALVWPFVVGGLIDTHARALARSAKEQS
jgi:hypothetical protein